MKSLMLILLFVCAESYGAKVYYVSPTGRDAGHGTQADPWLTWARGFASARPGDTVYIMGGIYPVSSMSQLVEVRSRGGSPDKPISIMNYPGQRPVLDLSGLGSSRDYQFGIRLFNCRHWIIKGLKVKGVPKPTAGYCEGVAIRNCSEITLENMVVYDCGGDGFVISEVRGQINVINSDAYNNASTDRENGNGFTFSFSPDTLSRVNVTGCRAWRNLDDGFDCWDFDGLVSFDSCWAFNNGFNGGDGDGFKLGKISDGPHNRTVRILRHCLAANNNYIGFDHNDCTGVKKFYNCVAYGNTYAGFASDNNLLDEFHHNIAYKNGTNWLTDAAVHNNNSWNLSNLNLAEKDFLSLNAARMMSSRHSDGSLPSLHIPTLDVND